MSPPDSVVRSVVAASLIPSPHLETDAAERLHMPLCARSTPDASGYVRVVTGVVDLSVMFHLVVMLG